MSRHPQALQRPAGPPECPAESCGGTLRLMRVETRVYRIDTFDPATGSIVVGDCDWYDVDHDAGPEFHCETCDTHYQHDPELGFIPSDEI